MHADILTMVHQIVNSVYRLRHKHECIMIHYWHSDVHRVHTWHKKRHGRTAVWSICWSEFTRSPQMLCCVHIRHLHAAGIIGRVNLAFSGSAFSRNWTRRRTEKSNWHNRPPRPLAPSHQKPSMWVGKIQAIATPGPQCIFQTDCMRTTPLQVSGGSFMVSKESLLYGRLHFVISESLRCGA